MLDPRAMLRSVERLGRYELIRVLGKGGLGTVYEAVLTAAGGFRKAVAVKLLRGEAGDLPREARLGGLFRHAHLVEVYALEQIDGRWVCAMELMSDGSLDGRLLSEGAVIDVGIQVCAGLQHVHEELGLVHLDVKPGNLLLQGGVVKVGDLGMARRTGERAVGGTVGFMPPEQTAGSAVDARADVFAVGVTLAVLATGGTAVEAMSALPDSPLASIIMRCTNADPAERYPSVDALAQALSAVWDGTGLTLAMGSTPTAESGTFVLSAEHMPTHNLDSVVVELVGRSVESALLASALEDAGLVMVKGTAGIGKSALALDAARTWHDGGGGEVWRCDLGGRGDAAALVYAVATVLGISMDGDVAARVGHALAMRGPVVLLIDGADALYGDDQLCPLGKTNSDGRLRVQLGLQPRRRGGGGENRIVVEAVGFQLTPCISAPFIDPEAPRRISKSIGYSEAELADLPADANLGLGCGNPTAIASLSEGQTVLDLGSGAGIDCFLAAKQVGPTGTVIGVDMTPAMLEKARDNAERGGYDNVDFRLGEIEALPVADASVDVIISNCVLNLSTAKELVLAEAFRVLKPGGRIVISDMVSDHPVPAVLEGNLDAVAACLPTFRDTYLQQFRDAGFADARITEEKPYPSSFILEDVGVQEFLQANPGEVEALTEFAGSIAGGHFEATKG